MKAKKKAEEKMIYEKKAFNLRDKINAVRMGDLQAGNFFN